MSGSRAREAAATAIAGAMLAGAVGAPFGLGRSAAVVGGLNGAVCGWRRIYDWKRRSGVLAFVMDSSWALTTTAGALGSHAIAVIRGRPGYDPSLSERQGRHVYRRGFQMRPNFVITVGNVVSGAGDTSVPRRRRLVSVHEDLHVWQARWLGPAYPVLYAGWMALGGIIGALAWAARHRDRRLSAVVEAWAYYRNPFEWWAYSRDAQWPPNAEVAALGWHRPLTAASPSTLADLSDPSPREASPGTRPGRS